MPSIVVTGRDEKVTSRQKQHTEEKLKKLERFFDGVGKIEATLTHGSPHGAGEAEVELRISIRGGSPIVSHARSKELYAALDSAIDKAEEQLRRHKEKIRTRKGAPKTAETALAGEAEASAGDDGEEEAYEDIVERREFG